MSNFTPILLYRSSRFTASLRRSGYLLALVVAYLLFGALVLQTLEYDARSEVVEEALDTVEHERQNVLDVLWAHTYTHTQADWMSLAHAKLDMYERQVSDALRMGVDTHDDAEDDNPWASVLQAVFFAPAAPADRRSSKSITTIGYGNICPVTVGGKLFTVVYSLVGIPLCLGYLAEVGRLLTMTLQTALRRRKPVDDIDSYTAEEEEEISQEFDFSIPAALGVLLAWLLAGALMFSSYEDDWSVIDAVYFCFVTGSTIGFGDFVPSNDMSILLMMAYNLSTLSLCSMCLTTVQQSLESFVDNNCLCPTATDPITSLTGGNMLSWVGERAGAVRDRLKSLIKRKPKEEHEE